MPPVTAVARSFADLTPDRFAMVGAKPRADQMRWEYSMDADSVAEFHRRMDALIVHQIPDGEGGWHLIARLPAPVPVRKRGRVY